MLSALHKNAIYLSMKSIILLFSLVFTGNLLASGPSVKYECISQSDETATQYLMTLTEKKDDIDQTIVFLASKQQIDSQDFVENERFIIKEMTEDDEFITYSNQQEINPETIGESRLEMDQELTLKHVIMLSVESCGADYTAENCILESIFKCHIPQEVEPTPVPVSIPEATLNL